MSDVDQSKRDLGSLSAKLVAADPADAELLKALVADMAAVVAGVPADFPAVTTALLAAFDLLSELAEQPRPDGGDTLAAIAEAVVAAEAALGGQPGQTPAVEPPKTTDRPAESADEAAPTPPAPVAAKEPPAVECKPFVIPEETDLTLLHDYRAECLDHLAGAEEILLAIEAEQTDAEHVNTVFRAFHTIKGTSGFLGLGLIEQVSHKAENLLDRARSGKIRLVGGYADLALRSCDALKALVSPLSGVAAGQELPVPPAIGPLLAELADPEAAGIGEERSGAPAMRLGDVLVATGRASRETVERAAASQGESPIGVALTREGVPAADVAEALQVQKSIAAGAGGAEATVRVSTARLDSILDMVGELVIAHSMVAQDRDVLSGRLTRLARSVGHAGKIIRELQDVSMSLRMVPLKATFQKMVRLTRDLAHKSGKAVHLATEGEDTEIDRSMVERLNDPLVHMIRNAVDHGIEAPEQRAQAGKRPTGTVRLRAFQAAGSVVIELSDDGKGLDRDRILAKAVEKGLVEHGREMSDAEVFGLIFRPGFSTAAQVTDISGRGVGMDVVKKGIESIQGRVELASRPGSGTTFTIRVPLTTAITDAMLVGVGAERYLLPTASIESSFRPSRDALSTVTGRGEMVLVRGELTPVIRLHRLFNLSGPAKQDASEALLIMVSGEAGRAALMADEILGQQQVVLKSLGQGVGQLAGVAGGAILGDGRVGLVLDIDGLLTLALTGQSQTTAAA